MATGEALCEMVQKFELAIPKEQMEKTRIGEHGARPGGGDEKQNGRRAGEAGGGEPDADPEGLSGFRERRSASQPASTLVPAITKSGVEKIRPMPRVEKPRAMVI